MIEALDLHHRFGAVEALRGVSATFRRGRVTVVLGPNGAGKSTLLRLLLDLVHPSAGEVRLDGRPVRSLDRRLRAARLGYVAQRPLFSAALPVRAVVELGRIARGRRGEDAHIVVQALAALRLEADADRPVTSLSVGQQQRVSLARMLAQIADVPTADGHPGARGASAATAAPPPFLLLDEPFAALDPAHVGLVLRLLRSRAEAGCGVVAVVHDLPAAAALADDVVVLASGQVAAVGSAADVLVPDTLEAIYGLPFRSVEGVAVPTWHARGT